jgi:cytochrome P450
MCWIFHELAHNPDVQEKLYEEVEETFEKYGVNFANLTLPQCHLIIDMHKKYAVMNAMLIPASISRTWNFWNGF